MLYLSRPFSIAWLYGMASSSFEAVRCGGGGWLGEGRVGKGGGGGGLSWDRVVVGYGKRPEMPWGSFLYGQNALKMFKIQKPANLCVALRCNLGVYTQQYL
jgi:hypothetical protein